VNNGSSYIYETWHCINSGTATDCDYDNGDAVLWRTRLDQDLSKWEAIADYIDNQNTNSDTKLIPAGQAMALLFDEIALNNIDGITSITEFYTDDIHLNDMGNYYIACVMYATLFSISPVGLLTEMNNSSGSAYQTPNATLGNKLQQLALQSVCNYQNSSTGNCQTLSSKQYGKDSGIQITYDFQNIHIISKENTVKAYSIYNILGQKVKAKTNINKNTITIQKPNVDKNISILIIKLDNGKQISEKIIF